MLINIILIKREECRKNNIMFHTTPFVFRHDNDFFIHLFYRMAKVLLLLAFFLTIVDAQFSRGIYSAYLTLYFSSFWSSKESKFNLTHNVQVRGHRETVFIFFNRKCLLRREGWRVNFLFVLLFLNFLWIKSIPIQPTEGKGTGWALRKYFKLLYVFYLLSALW